MKMTMRSLLFLTILNFSFCAHQSIHLKNGATISSAPSVRITSHFVFWGLWQEKKIDLIEECFGENPLLIQEKYSIFNIFFSLITIGIYNPRTSEIWCENTQK